MTWWSVEKTIAGDPDLIWSVSAKRLRARNYVYNQRERVRKKESDGKTKNISDLLVRSFKTHGHDS